MPEAVIEIRPWSSPMVGNAIQGARVPVKGRGEGHRSGGCSAKTRGTRVEPSRLCVRRTTRTRRRSAGLDRGIGAARCAEGSRLPFQYVMALVKEGDKIPMWATLDDMKKKAEPERQLERGDTVAVDKPFNWWTAEKFWIHVDGKVIPQKGFIMMGGGAEWHGLDLTAEIPLPFGWITPDKANVPTTRRRTKNESKAKPDG